MHIVFFIDVFFDAQECLGLPCFLIFSKYSLQSQDLVTIVRLRHLKVV